MKKAHIILPFLSLTLLVGCAQGAPSIVLDSVGPDGLQTVATAEGALMVFSGVNIYRNGDPTNDFRQYSNYEIWSKDGSKRLHQVVNHVLPNSDDEPTRVVLLPGQYLVKAMGKSYNSVTVPIVIVGNRLTTVHLDGRAETDKSHSSTDKVYLPNGEVVGTRAHVKS